MRIKLTIISFTLLILNIILSTTTQIAQDYHWEYKEK